MYIGIPTYWFLKVCLTSAADENTCAYRKKNPQIADPALPAMLRERDSGGYDFTTSEAILPPASPKPAFNQAEYTCITYYISSFLSPN